jgi:hypothetical protein
MQTMGRSTSKEERRHVCWPTFQSGKYMKLCATSLLNIRKCAASHHFRHLSACLPSHCLPGSKPPIELDILLAISASEGRLWTEFRIPPPQSSMLQVFCVYSESTRSYLHPSWFVTPRHVYGGRSVRSDNFRFRQD